jgi:hypothetical protein
MVEIPARTGGEKKRPVLMVACGAPGAKPGREERFLRQIRRKREKSIYTENVLRYSENALAKIRAR